MRGAAASAPPAPAGRAHARSIRACANAKQITYDDGARRQLMAGIDKVVDAVASTIGPRGRNVVIEQDYGVPLVINDGVSIARAIDLEDPVENAGAQLVKEVAGRTNDSAGDGTTTASVLARAMARAGVKAVSSGANPILVKKGIYATCDMVIDKLKGLARPVSGREDILNVAAISAGNDLEVGGMIADALDRVGADGVLSIETSSSFETVVEVQEGMEIDRGFISPQFMTNQERSLCEYENARVLVTDQKIEAVADLIPVLEACTKAGVPLLIVAEDVTGDALATLVVNKVRGIVQACAIKAPGFGERRKALLQDIAIVTGAEFIAKDLAMNLADVELDQLGTCRRVTVAQSATILLADAASRDDIEARVAQLKKELSQTDSVYDTEKLSERIARLAGGVAVIKVGGFTEAEVEDRKLRVEDAKNATFAAVEEGIVSGGGAAHLHLSEFVTKEWKATLESDEERIGADIVAEALRAPQRQIAENSGFEGDVVVEAVLGTPFEHGWNAMTGEYGDLIAAGVIDPAKVTRSGIQNAASVAGIMLTTEAVIVEAAEEDEQSLLLDTLLGKNKKKTGGTLEGGLTRDGMPQGMSI